MISSNILSKKTFAIYGLGVTGSSVIRYFNKLRIKNYQSWDDSIKTRKKYKLKNNFIKFYRSLNLADYIIVSPGINIEKTKFKKILIKNKHKLITDLDLFFMANNKNKTIVVTGTNGKSTTCKIIEHLLKKNRNDVKLCGNIGRPILDQKIKINTIFVIEASSFQLAFSKFIKPTYALFLNLTKDHLDWHKNMKKYLSAKLKIFSLQNKNDYAFIQDKNIIKKFKKKYISKLKKINFENYKYIKPKIKNVYLNSKVNEKNLTFVYELSKILKIKKKLFLDACNSFRGLPHRHEYFYKKHKVNFINDSKATSFESSKYALQSNTNILWIVGGLKKKGDRFYLNKLKKNISQAFIIGKNRNFFKKQVENKIKFKISKNMKSAVISIFKMIKNDKKNNFTVLLSPASASYDQYSNFRARGLDFKELVKYYGNKYI